MRKRQKKFGEREKEGREIKRKRRSLTKKMPNKCDLGYLLDSEQKESEMRRR